jgi:hypothetical protein
MVDPLAGLGPSVPITACKLGQAVPLPDGDRAEFHESDTSEYTLTLFPTFRLLRIEKSPPLASGGHAGVAVWWIPVERVVYMKG